MELSLDRLTKHYGSKIAVDQVSATLEPGYMVFGSEWCRKDNTDANDVCYFGIDFWGGAFRWERCDFYGRRL